MVVALLPSVLASSYSEYVARSSCSDVPPKTPAHSPSFWLCFSKQALLPPASPPAARVGCEFLWVRGSRLICSRQPPWSLGNAAGSPWVFHQHPLEDEGSVEQGRSVCRAGVPGERGIPIRAGQPAASECWMGAR